MRSQNESRGVRKGLASGFALAGLLAVASATGGCAHPVASTGTHDVHHHANAAGFAGPWAPAGARLTAQLEQPIDTSVGGERSTFTARLVTPLRGAAGRELAPAGATIRGRIVSLGSRTSPRVRLEFDQLDTVYGPARLNAALRSAQYSTYRGATVHVPWGTDGATTFDGYGTHAGTRLLPYGGGPYSDGYVPYRPREVRLPAGAQLDLVLTRPLVAPR